MREPGGGNDCLADDAVLQDFNEVRDGGGGGEDFDWDTCLWEQSRRVGVRGNVLLGFPGYR